MVGNSSSSISRMMIAQAMVTVTIPLMSHRMPGTVPMMRSSQGRRSSIGSSG